MTITTDWQTQTPGIMLWGESPHIQAVVNSD